MAIEIVIQSENTRRLLEFAAWRLLHAEVGDETRFDDSLYGCSWEALGRPNDAGCRDDLDAILTRVCTARAEIDRLRSAAVGEAVKLKMTAEQLREALVDCRDYLPEWEGLWKLPATERGRLIAVRDEATRLVVELDRCAEAVA